MKRKWIIASALTLLLIIVAANMFAACSHQWGPWKMRTKPTCQSNGQQESKCKKCPLHRYRPVAKVPHDFGAPTCTRPGRCKFGCGKTSGSALGHSYGSATCTQYPKCVRCGEKQKNGQLAPHRFSTATCTRLATCHVCGVTTGVLAPHKFSDATCTALARCSVCNITTGSKLPHNYVDGRCKMCGQHEPLINR